jgi:hypothetical protein
MNNQRLYVRLEELKKVVLQVEKEIEENSKEPDACLISIIRTDRGGDLIYKVIY